MAIAIKSIPTLENQVASNFVENARLSSKKRGSISFVEQLKTAKKILEKAKLKN
ncbi:MAG: hypothetical protein HYU67_01585 [Flavobacteriia bacterium]|nr:hypothetical protein [Flavobacteriia bacterium]